MWLILNSLRPALSAQCIGWEYLLWTARFHSVILLLTDKFCMERVRKMAKVWRLTIARQSMHYIIFSKTSQHWISLWPPAQGADSAMVPRLSRPHSQEDEALLATTEAHLLDYSNVGNTVLVCPASPPSGWFEGADVCHQEPDWGGVPGSCVLWLPLHCPLQDWAQQHAQAENALEKRDKLLMDSYNRSASSCETTIVGNYLLE